MHISTPRSNLIARFLAVFLICCSSVYASSEQTGKQKVTVVATDATLESVFKQIEKQTGLRFMYAVDALDVKEKVTVVFEKVTLDEVLESLLGKRGIEWVYREGVVSLKSIKWAVVSSDVDSNSILTVSGRVFDSKNNPVPGATIIVKGGRKGTKSLGDGGFILSGVEPNAVLVVSHVGFEKVEVVAHAGVMNIKMNEETGVLDETVIVGYGTTTKRFNTGNVTTIRSDEISQSPVSDPLLALQGRVPGMTILQTTGLSGGEVKVQIRGINSLRNGTVPLFIIDGVPYMPSVIGNTEFESYGALGKVISALNFINPGDIESIDVLKDADATAIYGSRGANGVVLITTKKGKVGDTKLGVNVNIGWQSLARKRKMLNTPQYLEMRREAFNNDGENITLENAPDLVLWDTTKYTDWQKVLVGGTAKYTDAQTSISGGNNLVQYLIGGNYHKETTIYPGEFYSRRLGTHFSIMGSSSNHKFKSSITGGYTTNRVNYPGADFAGNTNLPPNAPSVYDSNGRLNWENSTWENPFAKLVSEVSEGETNNLIANIDVSYRIFQELLFKINIGYNEITNNTFSASLLAGKSPKQLLTEKAFASYLNNRTSSWISEPQITYLKNFSGHSLNFLLGLTMQESRSSGNFTYAGGISEDALVRFPGAASFFFVRGNGSRYKYLAGFGRLGYTLNDRYLLNLTLRRDGSSRFGPKKRFSNFGSVGVGWLFSEEALTKDYLPLISFGKLRGSYGVTGNDQIGDYQYLDRYEFVESNYQNEKGLKVIGLHNPDFVWEKTRKFELGIELGLVKNRIFLTSSYYRNRSDNQLAAYELPVMSGATTIVGNIPITIQNNGWEITASSDVVKASFFNWSANFNLSIMRNKLLSDETGALGRERLGKSLSTINIYQALGVNPNTGIYQFANKEGKPASVSLADGYHSDVDLAPTLIGAVQNSFRFKEIQLDVFFNYVKQKGNSGLFDPNWMPGRIRNQSPVVLDRWTHVGDNVEIQKFSQKDELVENYAARMNSSGNYTNASFVRCKNAMLSWQMTQRWCRAMHLSACRVYLQAQNLFTITNYPGWDPETLFTNVIPPLRTFTTGIQVTL